MRILLFVAGPSHFKAYQQPFLYCQVLFLTAQFEAVSNHCLEETSFQLLATIMQIF